MSLLEFLDDENKNAFGSIEDEDLPLVEASKGKKKKTGRARRRRCSLEMFFLKQQQEQLRLQQEQLRLQQQQQQIQLRNQKDEDLQYQLCVKGDGTLLAKKSIWGSNAQQCSPVSVADHSIGSRFRSWEDPPLGFLLDLDPPLEFETEDEKEDASIVDASVADVVEADLLPSLVQMNKSSHSGKKLLVSLLGTKTFKDFHGKISSSSNHSKTSSNQSSSSKENVIKRSNTSKSAKFPSSTAPSTQSVRFDHIASDIHVVESYKHLDLWWSKKEYNARPAEQIDLRKESSHIQSKAKQYIKAYKRGRNHVCAIVNKTNPDSAVLNEVLRDLAVGMIYGVGGLEIYGPVYERHMVRVEGIIKEVVQAAAALKSSPDQLREVSEKLTASDCKWAGILGTANEKAVFGYKPSKIKSLESGTPCRRFAALR